MSLSQQQVENIANLARLAISEKEVEATVNSLNNILSLVEQMSQVDTSKVLPMAHPLDLTQRLRTDEVTEEDQREHFQSIAPATEDGCYLVPKVIE